MRYQETGRNVREELLRNAIRLAFTRLDAGDTTCVSPCVGTPVPYSTATLALPKKAREPVQPQTRIAKAVDPADLMRETMIDSYVARMAVTKNLVANRLLEIATSDFFSDLDAFEPKDARDVAILYEARSGTFDDFPGIEMRRDTSGGRNAFITGPAALIRRQENKK